MVILNGPKKWLPSKPYGKLGLSVIVVNIRLHVFWVIFSLTVTHLSSPAPFVAVTKISQRFDMPKVLSVR